MSKKNILIVEDNFIIAEDIKQSLVNNGYNVIAIIDNAIEAIEIIKQQKTDLILIDIIIKGDKSGIELAEIVSQNFNVPFVYLTSNTDKATIGKAIKFKPKAYIVKPFTELDILTKIELAFSESDSVYTKEKADAFLIKVSGEYISIITAAFLFAKSDGNYLKIKTVDNTYIARMSFKELLQLNQSFLQIHKSYVVNTLNITSFTTDSICINKVIIPLGRAFKSSFLKKIKSS